MSSIRELIFGRKSEQEPPQTLSPGDFVSRLNASEGAESVDLLEAFLSTADQMDAAPGEFFLAADIARREKRPDLATRYLELVRDRFGNSPVLFEKLGFVALENKNAEDAAEQFRAGVVLSPDYMANWYGLFLVEMRAGNFKEAIEAAERCLDWDEKYNAEAFAKSLLELAERSYASGLRRELGTIYRWLQDQDLGDLVAIRYGDILLRSGDTGGARRAIAKVDISRPRPNKWETCILAEILSGVGDRHSAEELSEALLGPKGFHVHFLRTYFNALGGPEQVRKRRELITSRFSDADAEVRALVRAAYLFAAEEYRYVVSAYKSLAKSARRDLASDAMRTSYRLIEQGKPSDAKAMAAILAEDGHHQFAVVLLQIHTCFAEQDFDLAAELLSTLDPNTPRENMEKTLKEFELACFRGNYDEAGSLEPKLYAFEDDRGSFLAPVLRFRAELKDWPAVCDTFLKDGLPVFRIAQLGDVVFRAFTSAGRTGELAAAIEAFPGWRKIEDLCRLRAAILEHDAVDAETYTRLLNDPTASGNPVTRRRLQASLRFAATPHLQSATPEQVLFFCTNTSYRRGTAVALASILRSSTDILENTQVIVVSDEEDGLSPKVFSRIAADTGLRVQVEPISQYVDDFSKLDAAYGVFTSGHELSAAAYYRIFFARKLAEDPQWKRAVYLDSDIVVLRSLDGLLNGNLHGKALAARREVLRPEVVVASKAHGMRPENYFNSGVLAFDMAHQETCAALDRSIEAIHTKKLFFHDQCALNIGFKGHVDYMDEGLNFFVPPSYPNDASDTGATILHYLDRPKPWEPTYTSATGLPWLDNMDGLISMIGPQLARELFASPDKKK